MNFEELLRGKECACGMHHTCSIKHVVIGKDANKQLGSLLGDYSHILLAADENTYAVCGEEIRAQLGDRLETLLVYKREGLLIPNEEAVGEMDACLTEKTDLIIASALASFRIPASMFPLRPNCRIISSRLPLRWTVMPPSAQR